MSCDTFHIYFSRGFSGFSDCFHVGLAGLATVVEMLLDFVVRFHKIEMQDFNRGLIFTYEFRSSYIYQHRYVSYVSARVDTSEYSDCG